MVRPQSRRCRNAGSEFFLSEAGRPAVSRAVHSQMIRPQNRPLQSKIWAAPPVPSMNHAPLGAMADAAVPGTGRDNKAMTSEAARAARPSQSAQQNGLELACAQFALPADYAMTSEALSKLEGEAPDVPVHQPPDREDDKDGNPSMPPIPTGPP